MKIIFAGVTVLLVGVFVSSAAQAACTTNPRRMGWDAAENACDDIAQGYVPGPFSGYGSPSDPEKTCTIEDVVRCKNAMSQYLREHRGCSRLIEDDVNIYSSSGDLLGTSREIWRSYVLTTCNR